MRRGDTDRSAPVIQGSAHATLTSRENGAAALQVLWFRYLKATVQSPHEIPSEKTAPAPPALAVLRLAALNSVKPEPTPTGGGSLPSADTHQIPSEQPRP